MLINADFSAPAAIRPLDYQWVASPQSGVERVLLDRVGGEVARATSLVRYAAGSDFPPHRHAGGEEILVLSGTFSDENGDYPAGWYLRNPPGSSHRPHSHPGALILVKLRQMRADETQQVRIDSGDPRHWRSIDGREVCPLFANGEEQVSLQRLAGTAQLPTPARGGIEIFVLSGALCMDGEDFVGGSWLRLPDGAQRAIRCVGAATLYVKTGHLSSPIPPRELL